MFTAILERPLAWSIYFLSLFCSWTITSTAPLFRSSLIPHFCLFIWYFLFAGLVNDAQLILACLFMQLALFHLLTPFGISGITDTIFESSLFTSFAIIIYPPSVVFLLFLLIFLLVFRNLHIRSLALMIFGLIFPPLIFGQIFYLTGHFGSWIRQDWSISVNAFKLSQEFSLLMVYLFIGLIGVVDYYRKFYNQINKNKRGIFMAMMFGLVCLGFIFSFMGENLDYALFVSFPMTVFLGRFIETKKTKTRQDFWLWIFLLLSVAFFIQRNYY